MPTPYGPTPLPVDGRVLGLPLPFLNEERESVGLAPPGKRDCLLSGFFLNVRVLPLKNLPMCPILSF